MVIELFIVRFIMKTMNQTMFIYQPNNDGTKLAIKLHVTWFGLILTSLRQELGYIHWIVIFNSRVHADEFQTVWETVYLIFTYTIHDCICLVVFLTQMNDPFSVHSKANETIIQNMKTCSYFCQWCQFFSSHGC